MYSKEPFCGSEYSKEGEGLSLLVLKVLMRNSSLNSTARQKELRPGHGERKRVQLLLIQFTKGQYQFNLNFQRCQTRASIHFLLIFQQVLHQQIFIVKCRTTSSSRCRLSSISDSLLMLRFHIANTLSACSTSTPLKMSASTFQCVLTGSHEI